MENSIDLSRQNLTWEQFEKKINELKDAEIIDLSYNRIDGISDKILALEKLQSLNLSYNQLTDIPLVLFQLPNLQTIVVSHNRIQTIPKELKDSRIENLIARYNRISEIDWTIISNLVNLDLNGNQIKEFRLEIPLPKLEKLTIGNNPVKTLELDSKLLPKLRKLHMFTKPEYISRVSKRLQPCFLITGNVLYLIKDDALMGALDDVIITIDLSKDPIDLKEEELIHQTRYHQILKTISDLMDKGQDYSEEKRFKRVHNIITLSGSRGTGKTTLLQAINKAMVTNSKFLDAKPLEIIDPTLIEEKGHIFLNIITMIRQEVYDYRRKRTYDSVKVEKWENTLKDLAGGLPLLDGIQGGLNPADWNDPQYIMFSGLNAVKSAIGLEKNFHKFIRLSLELLDKKFFVLFFDDADNDFAKGWPVLETLRKYLTSPQLIILISGDLDLFSYLVRKKQWENFGKALLKNEFDQDDGHVSKNVHTYPQIVEELESQYLVKLMSPQYRITLDSILAKQSRGEHINVMCRGEDGSLSIKDVRIFYRNYLAQFWGIRSKMAQYDYTNLFMSLPIRSQIELMQVFDRVSREPESSSLNASKALTDIFYSELKSAEVDVWELVNEYGEINIYILRFLLETRLLDEGSQLYPRLSNVRLDACVTALGCMLAVRFARRPHEIFDYIIRISYPVSKSNWPMSGYWDIDVKEIYRQSIDGLVDHAYLKYDYGMRKIASLESAYVLSFADAKPAYEGLIPIYALNRFAKDSKDSDQIHIDQLFNPKDLSFTLAMIPAFAVRDSNHVRGTFFSFYNLLAAVGQLLQCDISLIEKELHKLTTFRVYPSYFNHDEKEQDEERTVEEVNQDVIVNEKKYAPLVNDFVEWKKSLEASRILIPPFVVGRAMVRTQSSFTRIETAGHYVGTLFHRMLAVFLNAILVEEQNERGSLQGMRLSNPVGADTYLVGNIHSVFDSKLENVRRSYLSYHLLHCPLILAYMSPEFIRNAGLPLSKYNIYNTLKCLRIKDMEYPKVDLPQKMNRRVLANQEDADRLVILMKARNLKREQVDEHSYMDFVRRLFANKKRPNKAKEAVLLEMIRNSDKW